MCVHLVNRLACVGASARSSAAAQAAAELRRRLGVELPAPRARTPTDDDAELGRRGPGREQLVLDVLDDPFGRAVERVAEAAAAGVEEQHVAVALDARTGAEHPEAALLGRARR